MLGILEVVDGIELRTQRVCPAVSLFGIEKTGQRVKKGQVVARLSDAAQPGEAFLRYAGVAAVYIIYRYRGNGGQRVADKTLVGVC